MSSPYTAFRSFRIEKGLSLEERKGMLTLYARASVKGEQHYHNTETSDFARAERIATGWFRKLVRADQQASGTLFAAAEIYFKRIQNPKKLEYTKSRWNGFKRFFTGMDCLDVTTKVMREYTEKRLAEARSKGKQLKVSTLHKDLVIVRHCLRTAEEEGWISAMPASPRLHKEKPNARPWFELSEWETIKKLAKTRASESGLNPRTQRQREELYDFIMMMFHTCGRVDEVRKLRVKDCTVVERPTASAKYRSHLRVAIQGKTGNRTSIAWSGAVKAYERLVERHSLKPDDLLFKEHHRDGFRELLEKAELRYNAAGALRNLKSIRSTALYARILQNPRINLLVLAKNAGTSVQMLDRAYLRELPAEIGRDQLL